MSGGFTSNVKGISIKKIRKKLASSRKFWNDSEIMFFLQFKVFSENRNSKLQSFWSLMHSNHWSYKPYKPHVLWCSALCVYSQTGMYNPLKSNLDSKDNDGLRRGYLVVLSQRLECITHGSIILLLLLSLSFESRLSPLIGERTSCRIMYSKKSSTNVTLTHIRGRHFFLRSSQ